MTKNLIIELSRAFETDFPPIHAVGIAPDGQVYVVAEIYDSYYPAMPVGERNHGYISTSICELVDKGSYCGLKFVENYRVKARAQEAFKRMASEKGFLYASDQLKLNHILGLSMAIAS